MMIVNREKAQIMIKSKPKENRETPSIAALKASTAYVRGLMRVIGVSQIGNLSKGNRAPERKNNGNSRKLEIS